jgi:hypothetical protein
VTSTRKDRLADAIFEYFENDNGEQLIKDLSELLAQDRDHHLRKFRAISNAYEQFFGQSF